MQGSLNRFKITVRDPAAAEQTSGGLPFVCFFISEGLRTAKRIMPCLKQMCRGLSTYAAFRHAAQTLFYFHLQNEAKYCTMDIHQ